MSSCNTVGGAGYSEYLYNATVTTLPYSWSGSIINAYVHPGELDPGESMYVNAYYPGSIPFHSGVGICTNNGVYASTIV